MTWFGVAGIERLHRIGWTTQVGKTSCSEASPTGSPTPQPDYFCCRRTPTEKWSHLTLSFWERLTDLRTIQLGDSGSARFGDREIPTAYAAALVDWYGGAEGWNHYLAVHRNGAVEVGFGSRGGRTGHEPNGDPVRGFSLSQS